jgi:hypothetical protein
MKITGLLLLLTLVLSNLSEIRVAIASGLPFPEVKQ